MHKMNTIKTLGELKKSGWISTSIKDEIRRNLIHKIKTKETKITSLLPIVMETPPYTFYLHTHNFLVDNRAFRVRILLSKKQLHS